MGVDTKAIIRKNLSLEELKVHAEKHFGGVEVETSNGLGFDLFYLNFADPIEKDRNRSLAVFLDPKLAGRDYGIEGTLLSLGCWGGAVDIMKVFLKEFGGYLDENDCDATGFEPHHLDKFSLSKDFTPQDKLRQELASEIGYENMVKAMKVFETLNPQ